MSDYINKKFHLYTKDAYFTEHLNNGLINPESICFLAESSRLYAQGIYFGIDKSVFELLKNTVNSHGEKIQDILGEGGTMSSDNKINTLKELENFLSGYTTTNTLSKILSDLKDTIENEITAMKGKANGFAPLDSAGKVPAANLPSYVDDVLEYNTRDSFPNPGEEGKIYVAKDSNLTYRWSGTSYVEISPSIALGETSSTAYPGNKGAQNATDIANHKNDKNNPHGVTKSQVGLANVDNTSDANKPISSLTQAALNNKVDKVSGKGLSTNDFTDGYKNSLDSLGWEII